MKSVVLIFVFTLFIICSFGQTKYELEKKRRNSLKEIEFTNKLINITAKNKKYSLNKVLLINSKIKTRKNLIKSINDEIDYLNNNINTFNEIIITLEKDLKTLKNEYAKLIYYSYLHRNKYDKIMFLLASDNFNTAFKRIKYLQQYSNFRMNQANKIEETKKEISDKVIELELLKSEKSSLLNEEKLETQKLSVEKIEKNREFRLLAAKERDLKLKLKKQNDIANRLQKEITRIIEKEARLAAAKHKNNTKSFFQLTPEEALIADIFVKNRSKLPWPTERGVITGDFGEQPHPFLKGIKINNGGVDISTTEGAIVRAIFDGTVSGIFAIPGAHKTIIIRHGNYLSVYSNLKNVTVAQGDKVKTKQTIGVVYTEKEKDHKTVLQFQIWKEDQKLNPAYWLAKGQNGK